MKTEYVWTEDNLRLMGVHYPGDEVCVLEIHGMSGNFIENCYADVLGNTLYKKGTGFIYGHNRGYNHINDIATKPTRDDNGYNFTRIGAMYEQFEDSPKDISAWLNKCRELGYKKIILMGHSLGCNKVVYYLSQNNQDDIIGVILTSPPDMVGLFELERYQPNHNELKDEAVRLVNNGSPRQLVSGIVRDFYTLSAQTYLSLSTQGNAVDNFPVNRNPEKFEQLAKINVPILGIMGEYDDIEIHDLRADIELIKSKATSCPDFQIRFINGGNHNYENREEELVDVIVNWVSRVTET
jgi:pimeloyl-ACP methyl ester carboxylesterase